MTIFAELLVLLVATRVFGEVAERIGQPASAGEIMAGIGIAGLIAWIGPGIPFLENLATSHGLELVASVGIFVLVLAAGIELEPSELATDSMTSLAVALGGMVLPLVGGFGLAWIFLPDIETRPVLALLTGVALSISAVPVTVKVLSDLELLHSRIGRIVVSAAVFDDIIGLFLLAILLALIEFGQVPGLASLALLVVKIAVFFLVTTALGAHVYPHVSAKLRAMQSAALELSALAMVALGYGLLAEILDMHWIIGAFMAGLYFEKSRVGAKAYDEVRLICGAVTRGFLGPLFFAWIGLRVDLGAVTEIPLLLALLIIVAFAGKLAGAALPALWGGLDRREALAVGFGMSTRGAVELVVLSLAWQAGLFSTEANGNPVVGNLFSALVLVGVITTLVAPIFLRLVIPKGSGSAQPSEKKAPASASDPEP